MRCYNGCPDEELQALLNDQANARQELAAAGLRATYFPMEGKWQVFDSQYRMVGEFHATCRAAADELLSL